jgi:uncharacterized protein DUF2510
MLSYLGRAIAAVGLVLGFVAIWLDAGGGSKYWDAPAHLLGIVLLICAIVGAGLLVASLFVSWQPLHRMWPIAALILAGMYIFLPLVDKFKQLGIGGWLGFASTLTIAAGALIAALDPAPARTLTSLSARATPPSVPAGSPSAPPAGANPAAGWHPDPIGKARLRYWDGERWTEETAK